MKKFLVHYLSHPDDMKKMATATPEEKAAGMKPWMDWKEKMGANLVEMGSPMMGALKIKQGGHSDQMPSNVTGYSIIQANDMDNAKSLLSDHPHLQWSENCSLEVFECISM